jgi:hypothetical protein
VFIFLNPADNWASAFGEKLIPSAQNAASLENINSLLHDKSLERPIEKTMMIPSAVIGAA